MTATYELQPALLDHRIDGEHLRGETLRVHLGEARTVVCFLRHFG